jgi:hypothetical protein
MNRNFLRIWLLLVATASCGFGGYLLGVSTSRPSGDVIITKFGRASGPAELLQERIAFAFCGLLILLATAAAVSLIPGVLNVWHESRRGSATARRQIRRVRLALVMAGVVAIYPLSFGPFCWLVSRFGPTQVMLSGIYRPIIALAIDNPATLRKPILSYANLGVSREFRINYGHRALEL